MSRDHYVEDVVNSAAKVPPVSVACDAKCDAISADRVQLLARAVMLVAGMAIPEQMRAAVLERLIADLGEHPIQQPDG